MNESNRERRDLKGQVWNFYAFRSVYSNNFPDWLYKRNLCFFHLFLFSFLYYWKHICLLLYILPWNIWNEISFFSFCCSFHIVCISIKANRLLFSVFMIFLHLFSFISEGWESQSPIDKKYSPIISSHRLCVVYTKTSHRLYESFRKDFSNRVK